MSHPSVEERLAVEELFARYLWSIDTGDVDTLVSCFTEDGSLESPAVGSFAGHDQVRAFAQRFADYRRRGSQLRHVMSNLLVDTEGDQATARCYLLVYLTRDGQSKLLGPGRYECTLRREDGAWRFVRRLVVMDHDYDLGDI